MAGDEAAEVAAGHAETGEVVPAAHVFAGCREAGHLAEYLEQAVVVQVQKDGMIFFKTAASWGRRGAQHPNKGKFPAEW
jgi:hypothetical protein